MLFHLFVFFSHMNWCILYYSVGKLTIRMMYTVKLHSVNIPSMYVVGRYCPSFLFLLSAITLSVLFSYLLQPQCHKRL